MKKQLLYAIALVAVVASVSSQVQAMAQYKGNQALPQQGGNQAKAMGNANYQPRHDTPKNPTFTNELVFNNQSGNELDVYLSYYTGCQRDYFKLGPGDFFVLPIGWCALARIRIVDPSKKQGEQQPWMDVPTKNGSSAVNHLIVLYGNVALIDGKNLKVSADQN